MKEQRMTTCFDGNKARFVNKRVSHKSLAWLFTKHICPKGDMELQPLLAPHTAQNLLLRWNGINYSQSTRIHKSTSVEKEKPKHAEMCFTSACGERLRLRSQTISYSSLRRLSYSPPTMCLLTLWMHTAGWNLQFPPDWLGRIGVSGKKIANCTHANAVCIVFFLALFVEVWKWEVW